MPRFENIDWDLPSAPGAPNKIATWEAAKIAVLMDIRDELKKLNRLLHCPNFMAIPRKLDAIHKELPTRRKKRVA
jgi:hypothetical protein